MRCRAGAFCRRRGESVVHPLVLGVNGQGVIRIEGVTLIAAPGG